MTYGYIYKTTNLTNGRIYIGQHKGKFTSKYLGSGRYLKYAVNRYGRNNFKVKQIASAETKSELDVLEIFYIGKYRKNYSVYNFAIGGSAPMAGKKHSKKTLSKMSVSHKGVLNHNFGKDFTGVNNPMYGRTHSIETRIKISKSNKGKGNPRLSKLRKGKAPWNKGIKGTQVAWNKGIPWSTEIKNKISESRKRAYSRAVR